MNHSLKRAFAFLLPLLFALGAASDEAKVALASVTPASVPSSSSSSSSLAKEHAPPSDSFSGISVPAHATDMFGPEAGFRISGWNSSSGSNKLVELVADGTAVKKGDVIARFDFQAKDALSWINEKLAAAQATSAQRRIETQQVVDGLRVDKKKREIDAQLAQINVDKERALSQRQADGYRISRAIADFEVSAVALRIASAEKENEAENAYQDLLVAREKQDLDIYAFYEKRYVVTAPHDGIVRHAFNGNERRKVQKGDNIPSGLKVMSVAKDAILSARFFVPEHRLFEIKLGDDVIVTTASSAQEYRAVVRQIDFFPQELGFLLENNNLPNGREKAFAVVADLVDPPATLTAGTELIVKKKAGTL